MDNKEEIKEIEIINRQVLDQKKEPLVDSTKQESATEVIKEETFLSNTPSPLAETGKQASEIMEAAQVSKEESTVDPTKESETEVMKDKVSAAEIEPGPITNNSQIPEAMNEVYEEELHVESTKQESIDDVPPEENTPPPNNESYPEKLTKPPTTITDKQDKFVQKMVCVAAELEREYRKKEEKKGTLLHTAGKCI